MAQEDTWQIGPFVRHPTPILEARPDLRFDCPVAGRSVAWAAKDLFNPGAVVRDGKVCLLVRAEDADGRYAGTSRVGLATSEDGIRFTIEPTPVLYPADDAWQSWEWPGGCEDPRVVESPDGTYVCTYTAFDGKFGGLFVATSRDLRTWTKHGPAFAGTRHAKRWAKSGSIVTELVGDRLIAAKVDGKFWMYWGEGTCFAATSDDLIRWTPVEFEGAPDRYLTMTPNTGTGWWATHPLEGAAALRPLLVPRPGRYDSQLVEPGPPAIKTGDGIVLIYNGRNRASGGDASLPPDAYQPGQALFDAMEPGSCIARPAKPSLTADPGAAQVGQFNNVCFAQGLVRFRDRWMLYFGMADSRVGVAISER